MPQEREDVASVVEGWLGKFAQLGNKIANGDLSGDDLTVHGLPGFTTAHHNGTGTLKNHCI